MKENRPLYMPANISLKKVFWKGFGAKEAINTCIVAVIALVIILTIGYLFKVSALIITGSELTAIACAVMALQKVENNLSMVDYVKIRMDFNKNQQVYKYVYGKKCMNTDSK